MECLNQYPDGYFRTQLVFFKDVNLHGLLANFGPGPPEFALQLLLSAGGTVL